MFPITGIGSIGSLLESATRAGVAGVSLQALSQCQEHANGLQNAAVADFSKDAAAAFIARAQQLHAAEVTHPPVPESEYLHHLRERARKGFVNDPAEVEEAMRYAGRLAEGEKPSAIELEHFGAAPVLPAPHPLAADHSHFEPDHAALQPTEHAALHYRHSHYFEGHAEHYGK